MSSGPFLCYKELIPSTCVLCSAFFSTNGNNYLITSSSISLNVYRIKQSCKGQARSSLQQVATFNINGFPRDICCVEWSSSLSISQKTQHLLISLDKGKLVLVAFDAIFNSLQVVQMYNAEDGAIGDSACPRAEATSRLVYPGLGSNPFLTVDAQTRVACMSINAYELFFLSYRSLNSPQKPFTLHVPSLGLPGAIIDMCFISGYSNPTLAILQDTLSLPIGHVTKVRNTVTLTILAVNLVTKKCAPLWQQQKLPHDSCRLVPMSACRAVPAGVLVITLNAILIATQESVFGLATNGFAKVTVGAHIPLVAWPLPTGVELHASRWQEVVPGSFVSSLVDGSLLLLHLESTVAEAVFGESSVYYDVDIIGKSIETTCFSILPVTDNDSKMSYDKSGALKKKEMIWFFGSSVSDCLLMDVVMTSKPILQDNNTTSTSSLFLNGNGQESRHAGELVVSYGRLGQNGSSIYLGTPAATSSVSGPLALQRSSSASLSRPPKRIRQTSDTSGETTTDIESDIIEAAVTKVINEEERFYESTDVVSVNRSINSETWLYPEFSIQLADSIVVLGPILSGSFFSGNEESFCLTKSITWDRTSSSDGSAMGKSSAAAYITDREARDTLEVSSGLQGRASLLRVSKGIHLSKLAARNFTHVTHSCILPYEYLSENLTKKYCGTFFFLSEADGGTNGNRNRRYGRGTGTIKESSKIVLATETVNSNGDVAVHMDELKGENNAFFSEQQTVSVGLVRADIIVQSCSQCLRVVQVATKSDSGSGGGEEEETGFSVDLTAVQDVVVEEEVDMGGFGGGAGEYIMTTPLR